MANVYFSQPVTYSEPETPYVQNITGNPDGSETVTFSASSQTTYTYTVTLLDSYGDVKIHEAAPASPDFSGNDYYGVLTGYNNGGDFTVYNNSENGFSSHFTWLFTQAPDPTGSVTLYPDDRGGNFVAPACFTAGTRILTTRGEIAVEHLAIGDLVVTASGEHRPVRWLGHRSIDCTRHPNPSAVWPVRVLTGAVASFMPHRDLGISPGHNLLVNGKLMPARVLVNGATIVQERVDHVTYWHVELDTHDVILAEGLPAESYLDQGNRTAFANGGAFIEAHPDFEPRHEGDTCAPIRKAGAEVEAAKAALIARAEQLGHARTTAADLHLEADGGRVEPMVLADRHFAFALPAGCKDIALVSRSFVPSHVKAGSTDSRVLGVCVKRLEVDGAHLDLRGDLPSREWHQLEESTHHLQRWTKGQVTLPGGTRLVLVELAGEGRYWLELEDQVVARRA